eukprot:364971-Chlamydomonas_euryale.AAC.11
MKAADGAGAGAGGGSLAATPRRPSFSSQLSSCTSGTRRSGADIRVCCSTRSLRRPPAECKTARRRPRRFLIGCSPWCRAAVAGRVTRSRVTTFADTRQERRGAEAAAAQYAHVPTTRPSKFTQRTSAPLGRQPRPRMIVCSHACMNPYANACAHLEAITP